ncbi:Uma2 family endonuclease [Pseudanabaena sp. UWO310]|uniref:Uma2 family endonuclease n=1 Tax=Pseudanabaena sp. UWO310 TaxID=2480795 RepID=UPI0011583D91|nr:Uma2 family endonuclease [Pseudanabaena sp. UWO310]TYQ25647.1 Uma2 family endonuclease [Pseudanabaena sp. UWO310]
MLQIDRQYLPTSDELPDSDDTPVDNEDQNFLPNLLLFLLEYIWKNRDDWYFGVDMGIYHTTGVSPRVPVIPDGFLSLGVERRKNGGSRSSYVMWEEEYTAPILTLEVVSHTYGDEYGKKLEIYRQLGIKYYVIYNPQFWRRDGHLPFEVYKLVDDDYQLQIGEPLWMPEISLGIGRCVLPSDRFGREVLSWFDQKGDRYLTPEEQAEIERQTANTERQRADAAQKQVELLTAKLRSLGISEE